jgi:hypothetical protein
MRTTIRTVISMSCAALTLLVAGAFAQPAEAASVRRESNGALRFYDDNGNDRGYAWCLRRGGRHFSGSNDCSYYTYDQCRAAVSPPGGDCTPNPWAAFVEPPPQRARR